MFPFLVSRFLSESRVRERSHAFKPSFKYTGSFSQSVSSYLVYMYAIQNMYTVLTTQKLIAGGPHAMGTTISYS